jgi:hypothetical protein
MTSWLRRFADRLSGTAELPEEFTGSLVADEDVLAVARGEEGPLVATHLGLWVPEQDTSRRIGWHLVSKATWNNGVLSLIEAQERGSAGSAVLLRDLPARRFQLTAPARVPEVVHARVTGSIRSSHHRALPGGGAWFVQRKIPGEDGIVLQVRADQGTDEASLTEFAGEIAARLHQVKEHGHG